MARKYKFYLQDRNGNYYKADPQGRVTITPTKAGSHLIHSPMNWGQIDFKIGRNLNSMGVFRKIAEGIQFCQDGAAILLSIYKAGGRVNYEGYCKFIVEVRNGGSTALGQYNELFSSELNFADRFEESTYNGGAIVNVTALEQGFSVYADANGDTIYDIPLNDGVDAYFSGVKIECDYALKSVDMSANVTTVNFADAYAPPMFLDKSIGDEYFYDLIPFKNQDWQLFTWGDAPDSGSDFVYPKTTFIADYSYSAEMEFFIGGTGGRVDIILQKVDPATNTVQPGGLLIHQTANFSSAHSININLNGTYTFDSGFLYYLVIHPVHIGSAVTSTVRITTNRLEFNFHELIPATTAKVKNWAKVLDEVVNLMTGGAFKVVSTFLTKQPLAQNSLTQLDMFENLPAITFLTSGRAISKLTDPTVQVSFVQMMTDARARWGLGYSVVGNTIRIEKLDYFFDNSTTIASISACNNFKRTTANDLLYSTIRCGYDDTETEKLNGRNEVNSSQVYKLPVLKAQETLDLISPFIASIYKIEELRSQIFLETSRDRREDNSTFLVELNTSSMTAGAYNLMRWTGAKIANALAGATVYNVGLSPHRFVLRNLPYLRSILSVQENSNNQQFVIKHISGVKNTQFTTSMGGYITAENNDVIASAPYRGLPVRKLFKPSYCSFDAPTDENLMAEISSKPFGKLRVYNADRREWVEGFVFDAGMKLSQGKSVYTFNILESPSGS